MKIINISNLYKYDFYITDINLCSINPHLEVKDFTYKNIPVGHFVLGTKGSACYFNDMLRLDIFPKTLAYIPSGSTIRFREDTDYEYYKIYFRLIEPCSREEIIFSKNPVVYFNNCPKEIINFITEFTAFYSTNSSRSQLKFRSMIFSLLHLVEKSLSEGHNNPRSLISNALIFLQSNYKLEFTTKDLADMCSISEPYFRVLFKKYMKTTPTEYKNQMRIKRACEILVNSTHTVSSVSEQVGFNNVQYFCETFKKITGYSPLQYRNGTKRNPDKDIKVTLNQFGIFSPVDKNI